MNLKQQIDWAEGFPTHENFDHMRISATSIRDVVIQARALLINAGDDPDSRKRVVNDLRLAIRLLGGDVQA